MAARRRSREGRRSSRWPGTPAIDDGRTYCEKLGLGFLRGRARGKERGGSRVPGWRRRRSYRPPGAAERILAGRCIGWPAVRQRPALVRGEERHFYKNPPGETCWAAGPRLGRVGLRPEGKERKGGGLSPGKRERRVSPSIYFSGFKFLFSISNFKPWF
jgi:hypothetical protein